MRRPSRTTTTRTGPVHRLGPESLTWQYFGEWIALVFTGRTTLLQLMHPDLGAGVAEHSTVFEEPFQRLLRSHPPILGVVYDGVGAAATGRELCGWHTGVTGVKPDGSRYHALSPTTFFWAHTTFVTTMFAGIELFHGPLTERDKDRLYEESLQWYATYGLSMRPVPPTRAEFERYLEQQYTQVLDDGPVVQRLLANFRAPVQPPGFEWMPETIWRVLRVPGVQLHMLITAGSLPPVVRARLGLRWGPVRGATFRVLGATARAVWPRLPRRWRLHPRARQGFAREAGAAPAAPSSEANASRCPFH